MFSVLCIVLMAATLAPADGAKRVDAKEQLERSLISLGGSTHRAKREARRLSVRDLMGAGPDTDLQVAGVKTTAQGTKLWKMGETFRGTPVYDAQVTVETDAKGEEIIDVMGSIVQDIEQDTDGTTEIDEDAALNHVLAAFGDFIEDARDVKIDLNIFFNDTQHAFTGYMVEYKIEEDGQPRRPVGIVDGQSGRVVMKWNSLNTFCPDAVGVGGNENIGEVNYDGVDFDCLDVTRVDDVCYLENEHVRLVNMESLRWYNVTSTWSYDCLNATDGLNGAFSPALDAFFIGTQAFKMFDEWYGMRPVKDDKLIIRVHFGENYPNAFWNGVNTTFGDGRGSFHPFVSIDLVGHEIGHALVEQNSGLIWYQQPGAINEAFADITGEVLEHYIRGTHDWLTGPDISKNAHAVRYFINPTDNFLNIASMDDWVDYMQPHETGGILTHAFYRIVALNGQSMKEAYRVFLHANSMYWHHMSSIESAACDIMKSAYDLGQPGDAYREALENVSISVCDIENHMVGLHKNTTYRNVHVSNTTRPIFYFGFPGEWTQSVFVEAHSSHGDVHVAISDQTWLKAYDTEHLQLLAEGHNYADFNVTDERTKYYVTVTLSSDSAEEWDDVTVLADFTCLPPKMTAHGYFEYMRRENCEGRNY